MLLNLMAALSLASIGAVVGIASNPQSVDDVVLDKNSLIERKDANVSYGILENYDTSTYFCWYFLNDEVSTLLDVTLPLNQSAYLYDGPLYLDPLAYSLYSFADGYYLDLVCDANLEDYQVFVNGEAFTFNDSIMNSFEAGVDISYQIYNSHMVYGGDTDFSSLDYVHIVVLENAFSYADYEASHQIVAGIASGLTSVQHYATSLVSGFDALALDNGALTNSMAFAFTLLGIGTAIGICKLTFNWITGRHGM